MKQSDRITMGPAAMGGKPCIQGMRVTVDTVVGLMAMGTAIDEVLQSRAQPGDRRKRCAMADGRPTLRPRGTRQKRHPLNYMLSASVMEAQLSNHQSIMLDAVHHAMFVGYSARPES